MGGDIEGETRHLGEKVALSADGSRLIISDPYYGPDDNNDGSPDRPHDDQDKGSI